MFDLDRFIRAQNSMYSGYRTALSEIQNGEKVSHWIWYIFPQMKGLGHSYNCNLYGIVSLDEAKAYLQNDILRERLIEISAALLDNNKNIVSIVGGMDARKICSSMTLFHLADESIDVFSEVVDKFFGGAYDKETFRLLGIKD